jgi:hypothetical protein
MDVCLNKPGKDYTSLRVDDGGVLGDVSYVAEFFDLSIRDEEIAGHNGVASINRDEVSSLDEDRIVHKKLRVGVPRRIIRG